MTKLHVFLLLPVFLVCPVIHADPPQPNIPPIATVNVWPGDAPGEKGNIGEEKHVVTDILRIENVTVPTLVVYKPKEEIDTGACVMICPGGGYQILAYDFEGTEIAGYFNSIGVTAAVLKYRVPRRESLEKHLPAFQDAQRAFRLLRSKAGEWKFDPNRMGVLGFSAGGHLTMMMATQFDQKIYDPVDEIDQISARPDFVMPIYPAYLISNNKETSFTTPISPELNIHKDMPPVFISVTDDDHYSTGGSVRSYLAMKEVGVPCELHIFAKGGHGYALHDDKAGPAACWDRLLTDWLMVRGIIPAKKDGKTDD